MTEESRRGGPQETPPPRFDRSIEDQVKALLAEQAIVDSPTGDPVRMTQQALAELEVLRNRIDEVISQHARNTGEVESQSAVDSGSGSEPDERDSGVIGRLFRRFRRERGGGRAGNSDTIQQNERMSVPIRRGRDSDDYLIRNRTKIDSVRNSIVEVSAEDLASKEKPVYWIKRIRQQLDKLESSPTTQVVPLGVWSATATRGGVRFETSETLRDLIENHAEVAYSEVVVAGVEGNHGSTLAEYLVNEVDARQALFNEYGLWRSISRGDEVAYCKDLGSVNKIQMSNEYMDTLVRLNGNGGELAVNGKILDYCYQHIWENIASGKSVDGNHYTNRFKRSMNDTVDTREMELLTEHVMNTFGCDRLTARFALRSSLRLKMVTGDADGADARFDSIVADNETPPKEVTFLGYDALSYNLYTRKKGIDRKFFRRKGETFNYKYEFKLRYTELASGDQGAYSTFVSRLMGFQDFRIMRMVAGRKGDVAPGKMEFFNVPDNFNRLPRHLILPMMDMISVSMNGTRHTLREEIKEKGLDGIPWANIAIDRMSEDGSVKTIYNVFDQYHFFINRAASLYERFCDKGLMDFVRDPQLIGKFTTNLKQVMTPELVGKNLGLDRVATRDEVDTFISRLTKNMGLLALDFSNDPQAEGAKHDTNEFGAVLRTLRSMRIITVGEARRYNHEHFRISGVGELLKSLFKENRIKEKVMDRSEMIEDLVGLFPDDTMLSFQN